VAGLSYAESSREYYLETGTRFPRLIIWAMGLIKASAAKANSQLGLLDERAASCIYEEALRLSQGAYDPEVTVDVFQTGSGTGLNMNVNEVIALHVGERCGARVHPNDHVNMGQSSNDVVPTAIRLAAYRAITELVLPAARGLASSLRSRASEYTGLVKPGRTHLRDAMPVTFGMELEAYADAMEGDASALEAASARLLEVPLGGTAVGTGVNSHPRFAELALGELSSLTGLRLRQANRMRAMRSLADLAAVSGVMRSLALDLHRLSQDLRLLNSGPNTGLGEIEVPEEIAGSSIMPGKKNPVTLEAAMQAVAQVVGLDAAVAWASSLGELELNMGVPLVGYDVQLEASLLSEALRKVDAMVVRRLRANAERMRALAEASQALVTVFSPIIGYDAATSVAEEVSRGARLEDALRRRGVPEDKVAALRDLSRLVRPGYPAKEV
jgi:fumarate hydratase class II